MHHYSNVSTNYSFVNLTDDALFRIAEIYLAKSKFALASEKYKEVSKKYPEGDQAKKAQKKYKSIKVAAKRRYVVDAYVDDAIGLMEKDGDNKISMTKVRLRPHVQFSGDKKPTMEQLEKMHHQSHEQCFIANSVKTKIVTEIVV